MNWLIGSQVFLLSTVVAYCGLQLVRAKIPEIPPEIDALFQQDADQLGISKHDFVLFAFNRLLYGMLAVMTFVYQGGMALYYYRRRESVARALASDV